jgi:hypothetical protein
MRNERCSEWLVRVTLILEMCSRLYSKQRKTLREKSSSRVSDVYCFHRQSIYVAICTGILEQIEQLKPKYGSAPVTLPVPGVDLTPIADVTPTDDLKSSDIRLYCDNDKRWKKSETSGHWLDPIK